MIGDHLGMLDKVTSTVSASWRGDCRRYVHEEIDAVYLVYNEFKSVIPQRVVVERMLPIIESASRTSSKSIELTDRRARRRQPAPP